MTIELPSRVRISEDVLVEAIEDEAVLLDLNAGVYFGLDAVAHAMWRELASQPTVADARDALVASYEVAPEQLESDLAELIETLASRGLLQVNGDG